MTVCYMICGFEMYKARIESAGITPNLTAHA